jgi:hypothetical protein
MRQKRLNCIQFSDPRNIEWGSSVNRDFGKKFRSVQFFKVFFFQELNHKSCYTEFLKFLSPLLKNAFYEATLLE